MKVTDLIFGEIVIPKWLLNIVLSPEVQRLREIRLINTTSPSFPALSDARRYTHTMGVFFLASYLEKKISQQWSQREKHAFLAAALLHDIGTPPFGHILEYQLNAIKGKGWNHENFVAKIIQGTYRPEKRYHQIYYSNPLRLYDILRKMNIDTKTIMSIIRGEGNLGRILSGSIDIDNIDTVYRMATLLGLWPKVKNILRLTESLIPIIEGKKLEENTIPLFKSWQSLRQQTYEILAFDETTLSGQAMLTDCISLALQKDKISEEHWFLTDEQLLQFLAKEPETKDIIQRFVIGDFYAPVFIGWYSCPMGKIDLRKPKYRIELAEALKEHTNIPCSPYIFYDVGTFSKNLIITIKSKDQKLKHITLSRRSESIIASIFTPYHINKSKRMKLYDRVLAVLEESGLHSSQLTLIPKHENINEFPRQKELHLRA